MPRPSRGDFHEGEIDLFLQFPEIVLVEDNENTRWAAHEAKEPIESVNLLNRPFGVEKEACRLELPDLQRILTHVPEDFLGKRFRRHPFIQHSRNRDERMQVGKDQAGRQGQNATAGTVPEQQNESQQTA